MLLRLGVVHGAWLTLETCIQFAIGHLLSINKLLQLPATLCNLCCLCLSNLLLLLHKLVSLSQVHDSFVRLFKLVMLLSPTNRATIELGAIFFYVAT